MEKTGFIVFIIAVVLVAAGNQAQIIRAKADETPEPTVVASPTPDSGASGESETSVVVLEPTVVLTATATNTPPVSATTELQNESSTPDPTVTPTSTATVTALQEDTIRVCSDPTSITWTRRFTVTRTMNRWQVWQQDVSSRVMQWEQFIYAVMEINPSLWTDGFLFKVGKEYLLPTCPVAQ